MLKKTNTPILLLCALMFLATGAKCFAEASAELEQAKSNVISLIQERNFAEAEVQTQELITNFTRDPDLQDALYSIAREYEWKDRYGNAKSIYQQMIESHPDSSSASKAKLGVSRVDVLSLIISKNYDQAEEAIDKLLTDFSEHPDLPDTLYWTARRYEWSERYEQAKFLHKQIMENHPDSQYASNAEIGFLRAEIWSLILSKDYDAAEEATDELLADFSEHPDLPDTLFWTAKAYQWAQRYEQAKFLYKQIIENHPDSQHASKAEIGFASAEVWSLITSKDYDAAEEAVDELLADFPEHLDLPNILYCTARGYEWEKNYEQAKNLYEQIMQNHPDSPYVSEAEIGFSRTNVLSLATSRSYDQAEEAFDNMAADFSGYTDLAATLYEAAKEYEGQKEFAKAKQTYNQIIEQYPGSKYSITAQIMIPAVDIFSLIGSGKDAEAMEAVDELIADFNDHSDLPEATFLIGEEYYDKAVEFDKQDLGEQAKGNFTKALAIWERIATEMPPEALFTQHAWYLTGYCYRRLGEYEKAIEYWQKIVDDWPNYQYAWHAQLRIAHSYKRMKNKGILTSSEAEPKIKQAYEAVVENYPDCRLVHDAYLTLGRMNLKKGLWNEAAAYLEMYLNKKPNSSQTPNVLYNLGRAYEKMGNLSTAGEMYRAFTEMAEPDDWRVKGVKHKIKELEEQILGN